MRDLRFLSRRCHGIRTSVRALLLFVLVIPTVLGATTLPARAATAGGSLSLAGATTVGIHNTYNNSSYPYLADALDAGASLIELDTWTDVVTDEWKVSHDNPVGNSNNCVNATSVSGLYTGGTNQDLGACLDDIRIWLSAHPTAGPIFIKIEMKMGFEADMGMGPAQFDAYVKQHIGSIDYTPADLLNGKYTTLNAAAKANAWPSRSALAGKVVMEIIPGTVELANPFDTLHTDVEYATYLKDLYASGDVGNAMVFPSVLGAASGDPRTQYSDTTIRPWFVFFDGDASTYINDGIDTSWYDTNHYILIMTDAENVSPQLSDTNPSVADAQARVAELALAHASVVSCDWATLTTVLPDVLVRGTSTSAS